jgi:phosphoserine phosphatase
MSQQFVASDLEGTLSTGTFVLAIGRYLLAHGRGLRYRLFFLSQMPAFILNKLKFTDTQAFKNNWFLGVTRLLKGMTPEQMAHMSEWVIEHELWPQRRENVIAELLEHQRNGAQLILASGMFQPTLEQFAARIATGITCLGTPLQFTNDAFIGEVGAIGIGEVKATQVRAHIGAALLLAAYGDTEADQYFLTLSQHPTAVYPDEGLRKIAQEKGWRIVKS